MSQQLASALKSIVASTPGEKRVIQQYVQRIDEGRLTRDEHPETHFCVYFAAYDPAAKQVFIGHHKKSGKWLFNGGHIDAGETPEIALEREIEEEWGPNITVPTIGSPGLLTITEIENPAKQTCTRHYDIWYFVPVEKGHFQPDEGKLQTEFHQTRWLTFEEARLLVSDPATIEALDKLETQFS